MIQVVGLGSQDNFDEAFGFLAETGLDDAEIVPMLWEKSGNAWAINGIRTNSAVQMFSYDLSVKTEPSSFSSAAQFGILHSAVDAPWSPSEQ